MSAYHGPVGVETGWWDGPTYTVTIGGNEDGLASQDITIFGNEAARQVLAALRQAVEGGTINPAEGFAAVSLRGSLPPGSES